MLVRLAGALAPGFLALAAADAAAAQDISQPPPPSVSPVVVTATRVATPLDQVGADISLITADELEGFQQITLPDALQLTPGLNVVRSGGPGGLTSVFIRGADSDQTKVIVDGVEAIDPSTGGFDFGQQSAFGLARIEILRGPASSLYGPNAAGGVINIITAPGQGPARLSLGVEGGSFDTVNETARLAGGGDRYDYALNFAHDLSGATPITPEGLLAPGEPRIADRWDAYTGGIKLDAQASPVLGFGLVLRYVMSDYRFVGENYDVYPAIPDAAPSDQYARQLFARIESRLNLLDGRFQNVFGLAYTFYHTTIQAPDDGFGLPAATLDDGDRIKFDWQGTLKLAPAATLVLGAEADRDRLIDSPISASNGDQAGYAEIEATPAHGLDVAASVRVDHDDRFGDAVTWSVSPSYLVQATATRLKATYGTGFRAPTLNDLFVSYPSFDFYANPNLKPERSRAVDAGFEQPLAGGRLRFGGTGFYTWTRDLIDENADYTSYANIGRATSYGLESFVAAQVAPTLILRADYTYTFARDDIAQVELLRRPKDKVTLTADWRATRRLCLTASWLYKGGWADGSRDFSVPRLWASPYAVVNLAGSWDIGHGLTLFARIQNAGDRRYQEPVGYEQPGIGVFGGLKVDLDAARRPAGF